MPRDLCSKGGQVTKRSITEGVPTLSSGWIRYFRVNGTTWEHECQTFTWAYIQGLDIKSAPSHILFFLAPFCELFG